MVVRTLTALALALAALGWVAPAQAAARVSVANEQGEAVVDPTYATTLTVSGRGFQSVRGGHGGIYVLFGAVRSGWRPSQGGASGRDYLFVPDSQSRDNAGYQRFVAFPGSDTSGSANGGVIAADGSWSARLTVPGAVFDAVGADGSATRVDCRRQTCGVITIGAHGVANAHNETFTPVRVASLGAADPGAEQEVQPDVQPDAQPDAQQDAQPSTGEAPARSASAAPAADRPARAARPRLRVDRGAAVVGGVMPFAATGLTPGSQVSAVLDDGAAGAGPFLVGQDGGVAGVLSLPADLPTGTHQLRLFGTGATASVNFAVAPAATVDRAVEAAAAPADEPRRDWLPWVVLAACALVFVSVLARTTWGLLRRRRA